MKYLEQLENGECFKYKNKIFLLTCDFKNNNYKLCYNLNNGQSQWISPEAEVETYPIYTLNEDNNIIPLRNYEKIES
jgi:hypothetical protein